MKALDTLPPKARRLVKWAALGFLGAAALALILMTFLEFWTSFFIALGLYLALIGPLNAAARKEHVQRLRERNRH
ncbi:hypothetical protein M1E17_01185 [Arthrobacter sp. D1-29]